MLWEAPDYPCVRHLEAHYLELQAEADQIAPVDYDDWPQKDGYSGSWKVFCFYSRDPKWYLAASCPPHALRCPRTLSIVKRIPGVSRAGYSLLLPGTHIAPHRDGQTNGEDLLRIHMALRTNAKSGMRVGKKTVVWEQGRCLIFDGQEEHEAANMGDTPRVVLMVDVDRDALERELPDAVVELRPSEKPAERDVLIPARLPTSNV